jgi:glycyl-tRNA synthetase beta chain
VLVNPIERRERVLAAIHRVSSDAGLTPRLDEALIDEIVNLNEWPHAILGSFDPAYLAVPHEALIQTMQINQRFVPLLDAKGELSAHFIGIANIDSRDPAQIRLGYERVIRPRFADAKFFYDEDLKTPLADHQGLLDATVFQAKLGSLWAKSERVRALAERFASAFAVSVDAAAEAARLSKSDLMTRMVGEFPEIQGTVGRRLATAQGQPDAIAVSLEEIYAPRSASAPIAATTLGRLLAVCERADTLAGIFAVGLKPSGNKDPFALRRAALGLARTLIEGGVDLELRALLDAAIDAVGFAGTVDRDELNAFVIERLRSYYADLGVDTRVFDAVATLKPHTLTDFDARVRAAQRFIALPQAPALAAANKRIANILKKLDQPISAAIDPALFAAPAEHTLHAAWLSAQADCAPLNAARDYTRALERLATLREPIDAYFDTVMVMDDDLAVRHNRLALLSELRKGFATVADIALL